MKIRIRRDLCCGAQICIRAAPGLFLLDEHGYNVSDGKAVLAKQEIAARKAMQGCPEGAIALVDDGADSSTG